MTSREIRIARKLAMAGSSANSDSRVASRTVTAYEKPILLSAAEDRVVSLYMTADDTDLKPSDLATYAKDFQFETDRVAKAFAE